ncbi:MAG: UvrD-helicase domain-containing protein, partial [Puniceicoccales bacterium]|nr:UvrD-helicase domain-containing protein [Puniceicoccales bacterium]
MRQLHRLQLSTLDSFYQRLARMASFELGLPGAFTLLDERMADAAKERVLRRIFQRAPAGDTAHHDFLAAFRLATWGREARGVTHELEQFVDAAAALLHDFPDADLWGGAVGMPAGEACPWLPVPSPETVAGALTALETFAAQNATGGRTPASALATFADIVRKWNVGQPLNDLGTFFEKTLLTAAPQILRGDGTELIFNKKNLFAPPPVCDALAVVLRYLIGGALERHRQMTRGIYLLARQYDDTYDRLVRRAGQLTFADTVDMLSQHNLDIGFRLDGTTHHWLFDEFQDTSRRDWSVVADNLDAVLTDDSGERSAFLVGDVKQALYGWRGGDHSLLPKLCARYQLAPRALDVSWRSTPDVLAMPNAVFGNLKNAAAFLPTVTVAEWQRHWQTHSAAGGMAKKQGYAAWHICEKTGARADGTANNALRLGVVLERLREVRPFERGLTCGLLTQTNKEAREATRFLRDAGFRATSEADVPVAEDNPIVPAFLALLGVTSHPQDGYAEGIVKATAPIAAWVAGRSGMAKARAFLLNSIIEMGFAPTLRTVADELGAALPDDAFSARRIGQLFATAREFDATGNRDTDDFVRFAQRSLRRDTSEADSVQVMTIHKAKGLEFDIVFLPFLEGNRLDSARKDNLLTLEHQVLSNPGKLICEHTQGLSANLKTREADACYEELCRLYVALTRARYATCVITTAAGASKTPDGVNFPTLLELTLGGGENAQPVWESGARDWFCAVPLLAPSSVPSPTAPPATAAMAPRRQWVRRRPS